MKLYDIVIVVEMMFKIYSVTILAVHDQPGYFISVSSFYKA